MLFCANHDVSIIVLVKYHLGLKARLVRSLTANQEFPGSSPGLVEG